MAPPLTFAAWSETKGVTLLDEQPRTQTRSIAHFFAFKSQGKQGTLSFTLKPTES